MLEDSIAQSENTLIRQQSLVDQVFKILYERIISGVYPSGSKLPTGDRLAEELNVSRSTVRMAVSKLEDRKLVQRRQGVGTYVRELIKIPNPLNEFIELSNLIKDHGYQPGYSTLADIVELDGEMLEILQLQPGSKVLQQRKVFTADGDPFIYVVNHIPVWVFEHVISLEEALKPDLTDKFVEFFEVICKQKISHFVSTVRAEIYENIDPPKELVDNEPQTPVLVINETGFNEEARPIVNSCEFHPGNWMTFQMIRRLRSNM
ncbi:MAG: GntR family transcriptional regulator [Chloroflexi bacterium]|nr:GntR family transcriptional regulator [Chloroflexota bacterium]MBL7162543.1 GntR family transcriptional regulator [Anaerolineales bacterium]